MYLKFHKITALAAVQPVLQAEAAGNHVNLFDKTQKNGVPMIRKNGSTGGDVTLKKMKKMSMTPSHTNGKGQNLKQLPKSYWQKWSDEPLCVDPKHLKTQKFISDSEKNSESAQNDAQGSSFLQLKKKVVLEAATAALIVELGKDLAVGTAGGLFGNLMTWGVQECVKMRDVHPQTITTIQQMGNQFSDLINSMKSTVLNVKNEYKDKKNRSMEAGTILQKQYFEDVFSLPRNLGDLRQEIALDIESPDFDRRKKVCRDLFHARETLQNFAGFSDLPADFAWGIKMKSEKRNVTLENSFKGTVFFETTYDSPATSSKSSQVTQRADSFSKMFSLRKEGRNQRNTVMDNVMEGCTTAPSQEIWQIMMEFYIRFDELPEHEDSTLSYIRGRLADTLDDQSREIKRILDQFDTLLANDKNLVRLFDQDQKIWDRIHQNSSTTSSASSSSAGSSSSGGSSALPTTNEGENGATAATTSDGENGAQQNNNGQTEAEHPELKKVSLFFRFREEMKRYKNVNIVNEIPKLFQNDIKEIVAKHKTLRDEAKGRLRLMKDALIREIKDSSRFRFENNFVEKDFFDKNFLQNIDKENNNSNNSSQKKERDYVVKSWKEHANWKELAKWLAKFDKEERHCGKEEEEEEEEEENTKKCIEWCSGDIWSGRFDGEKFVSGTVLRNYDNKDAYYGQEVDGKRSGKGFFKYASSGNIYHGEWKDDKKEGRGNRHSGT